MLRRDDDVRINIVSELPHAAGEGEDRISTQALCSQSRLFGFFRLFLKKHRCFSLFLSLSFQEFASDIPSHGSIGRSFRADMEDGRLDFIPVILIVIRKEYFALPCLCLIRWIGALIEENTACIHDVLDISKVSGLFVYLRCGRSHGKTDTVRYMLPADDVSGMPDIFQKTALRAAYEDSGNRDPSLLADFLSLMDDDRGNVLDPDMESLHVFFHKSRASRGSSCGHAHDSKLFLPEFLKLS